MTLKIKKMIGNVVKKNKSMVFMRLEFLNASSGSIYDWYLTNRSPAYSNKAPNTKNMQVIIQTDNWLIEFDTGLWLAMLV